jgi:hypothetical protein
MRICKYNGETFVAFVDISGFKELMKKDKALASLSKFYQYGYEAIKSTNNDGVEGIFVSDCGVLFVRDDGGSAVENKRRCLRSLLSAVKEINLKMLRHDFMLTTSIAYGSFKWQEKIEIDGLQKNPIYGQAYVTALLDNESGSPKIQPGQCRILPETLPDNIISNAVNSNDILQMIDRQGNHYYFYWMLNTPQEIEKFNRAYEEAKNSTYDQILYALNSNYSGKKILDQNDLGLDEDWCGNNASFKCPICGKVFIVSGMLHQNGRRCPRCGSSTGFCDLNGASAGGRAYIEW